MPRTDTLSWEDYRLLLEVARVGGIRSAADGLGLAPATARARLEGLEVRIGAGLFEGPAGALKPTREALVLLPAAEAMEARANDFMRLAATEREAPKGLVRIAAPSLIAEYAIVPALGALKAIHPGLYFELTLLSQGATQVGPEIDIALLPFVPKSDDFALASVVTVNWGLYAHRDYLAGRPPPLGIEDLAAFTLIGMEGLEIESTSTRRFFRNLIGFAYDSTRFRFRTDSFTRMLAAMRAGVGVGLTQTPLAARHPELVRVIPQFTRALQSTFVLRPWLKGVGRMELVHAAVLKAIKTYAGQS